MLKFEKKVDNFVYIRFNVTLDTDCPGHLEHSKWDLRCQNQKEET